MEPCCHIGRTPPCTDAILKAGIKKVISAVKDPNPKVAGKGFALLKKKGVLVKQGLFEQEAAAINEDFFTFIQTGRPFVTLKAAMTLNGLIAADSGDSKWISCEESRQLVHALRSVHDAVLIGLNTALCDNPLLTVRTVKGRNPIRIILSDGKDLPRSSELAKSAKEVRTMLMTPKRIAHPTIPFVEYVSLNHRSQRMPVSAMLTALGKLGIKSLLVEGGRSVLTDFIDQKGVDRFCFFMAPKLLMSGLPLLSGKKTGSIKEAIALKEMTVRKIGNDLLIKARRA